jgi:hypothetical protein
MYDGTYCSILKVKTPQTLLYLQSVPVAQSVHSTYTLLYIQIQLFSQVNAPGKKTIINFSWKKFTLINFASFFLYFCEWKKIVKVYSAPLADGTPPHSLL